VAQILETVVFERDGDDKYDIGYVRGPKLRQVGNRVTIQVTGFSYDGGDDLVDPQTVVQILNRTGCGAEFNPSTMTYTDYEYNWDTVEC